MTNTEAFTVAEQVECAIIHGQNSVVRRLIEGHDVDCQGHVISFTDKGESFLHLAAAFGNGEIVKYLIEERGVDVNHQSLCRGDTALHFAASLGRYKIVQQLVLKYKADCNAVNIYGWSPCRVAADSGHAKIVKLLVKEGKADINKTCYKFGNNAFHGASVASDVSLLKLMIELGADYSARNINGKSALCFAGKYGNVNTVKFLIEEKNLDPNNCCEHGLLYCVLSSKENPKIETVEYLVKVGKMNVNQQFDNGIRPTLLHIACIHCEIEVVKLLMEAGANHYAYDNEGDLPLHKAVQLGKVDILKYLSEETKMDVRIPNLRGETLLHLACKSGKLDCVNGDVNLLLHYGADISKTVEAGPSCLHFAPSNGLKDTVKYLVDVLKFDVNICTCTYRLQLGTYIGSPLNTAAFHGQLEVCKVLVELGADYVSLDKHYYSVLHYAALGGQVSVLEYFIKDLGQRKIIDCANDFGATPLHLACTVGNIESVKLLLENGANCNLLDDNGMSCLGHAASRQHAEVYFYFVVNGLLKVNERNSFGITVKDMINLQEWLLTKVPNDWEIS